MTTMSDGYYVPVPVWGSQSIHPVMYNNRIMAPYTPEHSPAEWKAADDADLLEAAKQRNEARRVRQVLADMNVALPVMEETGPQWGMWARRAFWLSVLTSSLTAFTWWLATLPR